MKKAILTIVSILALAVASGCSSVSRTDPAVYPAVKIAADLDINPSAQKEGTSQKAVYFAGLKLSGPSYFAEAGGVDNGLRGDRISMVRSAAVYNALNGKKDVMLVYPQYDTAVHSYLFGLIKTYQANVTGYEATVKRVYQIKE